ncbi:hypothetical protein LCGC14_3095400 [marine sediment metagenome]|uniref:Uncharacterized protein n=1 Tax=marine sediment metagenome TaxID=412755 RepID=A0A0F8W9W1_9ZZZZ
MCPPHDSGCFNEEEKKKLTEKGWSSEQVSFVENSKVEDKIKELI